MEIELIGQALEKIKEQDQNILTVLEDRAAELEKVCKNKSDDLVLMQREHDSLERLEDVSNNSIRLIHMIMPVIEVPLGIGIILISVLSGFSTSIPMTLFFLALIMEIDAMNTLFTKYPKLMGNNKISIKEYWKTLKDLFKSKKSIRSKLISGYINLLNATRDLESKQKALEETDGQIKDLRVELDRIEGYIASVDYLVQKDYFKELSDSMDIVQFVKEKQLKKVAN